MKKVLFGLAVVLLLCAFVPLNMAASCFSQRIGCRAEIMAADLGVWDTFVGLSGCDAQYVACCLNG